MYGGGYKPAFDSINEYTERNDMQIGLIPGCKKNSPPIRAGCRMEKDGSLF
jgi:hypothetical protein